MRKIYLADPIFQCDDHECLTWRDQIKENLLGYYFLDPMERDYRGVTDQFVSDIVEGDKNDIDLSDILLVNHVKPSVGTSMEILYAWERNKEVYIISSKNENSPWLIYHSTKIFQSVHEAIDFLSLQQIATA